MIILSHTLFLRNGAGEKQIPIHIHMPVLVDLAWTCEYEIGWPEGQRNSAAFGIDALQAMLMTLQKIGTEIYTSTYHKAGQLRAYREVKGYGFPVPRTMRDLLLGIDAESF